MILPLRNYRPAASIPLEERSVDRHSYFLERLCTLTRDIQSMLFLSLLSSSVWESSTSSVSSCNTSRHKDAIVASRWPKLWSGSAVMPPGLLRARRWPSTESTWLCEPVCSFIPNPTSSAALTTCCGGARYGVSLTMIPSRRSWMLVGRDRSSQTLVPSNSPNSRFVKADVYLRNCPRL